MISWLPLSLFKLLSRDGVISRGYSDILEDGVPREVRPGPVEPGYGLQTGVSITNRWRNYGLWLTDVAGVSCWPGQFCEEDR